MALYQRGRIWYADFYIRGERVQESTRTGNKRKAEKFYAARLAEVEHGAYKKPVKLSLVEFSERYLAHAQIHKRSWNRDKQMLGHLLGFFGQALLGDITAMRVEDYQQARVRKVCPATVNRELALLKHMLNLAERWDLKRAPNPVRMVKFLAEDNLQFQTLSDEDEKALLSSSPPYLQDMIGFALNTGMRSGEIFNLRWNDVDVDRRRLTVVVRKTRRPLGLPLNDEAFRIVRAWHSIRKCSFVFYNQRTGERFKDVKLGLRKACERAGLCRVTWHMFRHTFASRLIGRGADIVTVKELLGHSTVTVTMRYAHTNEEAKVRALRLLNLSDK
jgi:integrase